MILLIFFVSKLARIMPRRLIWVTKLMYELLMWSSWTQIVQKKWPQSLFASCDWNFFFQQPNIIYCFHTIVVRWKCCSWLEDKFVVANREKFWFIIKLVDNIQSPFNLSLDILAAVWWVVVPVMVIRYIFNCTRSSAKINNFSYFDFNVNRRICRFPKINTIVANKMIVAKRIIMIGPDKFVSILTFP